MRIDEQTKALVVERYGSGATIKGLAREMNISIEAIRNIVVKAGVYRSILNQYTSNPEYDFAKLFNAKFIDRFEYVGGYVNCESKINIKCLTCGDVFIKTAHNYTANKSDTPTCSKCVMTEKAKKKEKAKSDRSITVNKTVAKRYAKSLKVLNRLRTYECKHCGMSYTIAQGSKTYCSASCRNKSYNKLSEIRRQRKLKANGKVENISLPVLFKRDKGVCHICGEKCDYNDCEWKGSVFYAYDNYPSIDHVVALSLGGTHEWTNVRLAHRRCNSIKSDATAYVMHDGRMKLYL